MSRISQFLVHIFSSFACPAVKKKIFLERTRVLRLEFLVGKIFPQMLCLGRETKKPEHLGEKKFPQWIRLRVSRSTGEIFWPQMLCLGQETKKTEHLMEYYLQKYGYSCTGSYTMLPATMKLELVQSLKINYGPGILSDQITW